MRNRFLVRSMMAGLMVGLVFPALLSMADTALTSRVASVRNLFRYYINDLSSSDKDKFRQDIDNLDLMVPPIDKLQSQLQTELKKVQSAQEDYDAAERTVVRLRGELDGANQRLQTATAQGVQESLNLCQQMGGSPQNGKCWFGNCDVKNMAPCQAKADAFDRQIALIKSRLQSIANEVEAKQNQADAAEKTASAKQSDLDDRKSHYDQADKDLSDKKDEFEREARRIEAEINAAPKEFIKPKIGQVLRQTPTAMRDPGCFDKGCVPVSNLPEVTVPTALANHPQPTAAYNQLVKTRDEAVRRAEDARKALKDYITSGGTDQQELNRRYRADSQAQFEALKATYNVSTFSNLLQPVRPKAAEQNNAK